MGLKYDFGGWATKNDLLCSDGRTIRRDAFRDNDGQTVPLVWNHEHNDPMNVLGHALLENRAEGVYAYCSFNDTEAGNQAKALVQHGDITGLSIFANQLKQQGGNVIHGAIREVSLVLAGANPGAMIDSVVEHGMFSDDSGIIYTGDKISLCHAEEETSDKKADDETVQDVFDTMTDKQKNVVYALIGMAMENGGSDEAAQSDSEEGLSHADDSDGKDETIEDVINTMNDKQKAVMYALIGQALGEDGEEESETKKDEESEEGDDAMKHNCFDSNAEEQGEVLQHSDMVAIFAEAKHSTLHEAFLAHGIENIEYLFPEAKAISNTPEFIKRPDSWVSKVMNGTHHSPFSRIKTLFADITDDDARALGYLPDHTHRDSKGNLVDADGNPAFKKEEVFSLLKRSTTPTTIYKKQKIDRDDEIDITDMDVVSWIKSEMRSMLDEEIARAILIGDGRLSSSDDKINEQNIRPIISDSAFFTIKCKVTVPATATDDEVAKAVIRGAIKSRKYYRGSGSPTAFMTEDHLTNMLLLEDTLGHALYDSESAVATKMRVKECVTVPVMENYKDSDGESHDIAAIIVNLQDYYVGADKGGSVNMFDDFDIDYNAQKYLIETRCSGALVKPYSAIAIEVVKDSSATEATIAFTTSKTI